jgi:hypothetical protein
MDDAGCVSPIRVQAAGLCQWLKSSIQSGFDVDIHKNPAATTLDVRRGIVEAPAKNGAGSEISDWRSEN